MNDIPRRPPFSAIEQSPLQRAFENYQEMERQLEAERNKNAELAAMNQSLMIENGMLREAFETADNDRIRLQAIASTLSGELGAIKAVIDHAVRRAISNGIQAAQQAEAERAKSAEEKDDAQVRDILHRMPKIQPEAGEEPPAEAAPALETRVPTPRLSGLPMVDFSARRPI